MTEAQEHPPAPAVIGRGYESSEISIRGVLWFVVIFLFTAVVLHIALWYLLNWYGSDRRVVDVPASNVPQIDDFPEPNLQPTQQHNRLPFQDIGELLRRWDSLFGQMGWKINPQTGQPTIPDDIVTQLAHRYNGRAPSTQSATTRRDLQNATSRPATRQSTSRPVGIGSGR